MYSPSQFKIEDDETIRSFVRSNSFGIVFSQGSDGAFHDTHAPLLIADDLTKLTGHLARANPQWRSWEQIPNVRVVFHGPHAYISPTYYTSEFNVPTWNYTAVSVSGKIRIISERTRQLEIMHNLIRFYEASQESPWQLDESDERYLKLFDAVVFFEIEVTRLEAKFKLNQNKSEEDRDQVIQRLLATGSAMDADVARLMEEHEAGSGA